MWIFAESTLEFLEVNDAAVEKYGYTREQFLQMRIGDIRPRNDVPRPTRAGGDKRPRDGIWSHLTADGRLLNVKTDSHAIDFAGKSAVLVLAHDVTELVETQKALGHSEKQLRQEAGRAQALLKIADRLNAQLDVQSVLDTVCDEVRRALSVPAASVMLFDVETDSFVTSATIGLPPEYSDRHRPIARGIVDPEIEKPERTVFVIPDTVTAPRLVNRQLYAACGIRSILCACMVREGILAGAVVAYSIGNVRSFHRDDLLLIKGLADQATQAIVNARLLGEYQKSAFDLAVAYDKTLEGWSRALDLRDHETEGHCRRVSGLALQLGHAMGESPESLVHIRRGALLHDIGKMGIPDQILLKPGELSPEEWEIMRKHPEYARTLLEPIPYLLPAMDIPYCHHERWDGSGYPRGLREKEIPLAARIFSVTDVWDSLRSDRPYRSAWQAEDVRGHLVKLAGVHFDPLVVEAFLDLEPD